jgi:uncharacterized protein
MRIVILKPWVIETRTLGSIDEVSAAQWDALQGTDCPFLRHAFLAALEHSQCVGANTGWAPAHLTLVRNGELIAAAPVYRKSHSWGEFVFDFGWAQAYARHGLDYYPKLLCAVPFSPVNASRLLVQKGSEAAALKQALIQALANTTLEQNLSSAHALFVDLAERDQFESAGWLLRRDVQFHWRNQGYASFGQYLDTFTAEKRKKIKRERRRCTEQGITFETLTGVDLHPALLQSIYALHARTFHEHGHDPYLNLRFFQELASCMGDCLMVKLARFEGQPVAAAVFLWSRTTLYGRYWGAAEQFHSLHFECCYHQGIEFCIEQGIERFEPGTQGEHKVSRGFSPTLTWSAHHVSDPRFRAAIAAALKSEGPAVDAYARQIESHTPFRKQ